MKTFLTILSLACTLTAGAQTKQAFEKSALEEITADKFLAGGNAVDYDRLPRKALTPAPKGYEPYYLRDLPLHHSQREINTTEEYTDFELKLKPTADFKAQLMSRGQWIEIMEPQSLADEIVEWHKNAIERYKK